MATAREVVNSTPRTQKLDGAPFESGVGKAMALTIATAARIKKIFKDMVEESSAWGAISSGYVGLKYTTILT